MGLFHPFLDEPDVEIFGVEAAGHGVTTGMHAASITGGRPGVLHGNRTYLLMDADGQIAEAHSISAGLDYPGIGPEHAWLNDVGRVTFLSATDDEAVAAFQLLQQARGHHPGAGAGARAGPRHGPRAGQAEGSADGDQSLRPRRQGSCLGRGVPREQGEMTTRIERRFAALRDEGRPGLVTFVTAGDPDHETSLAIVKALPGAGADLIELGMPFSDPMADGPAIQAAGQRALKAGQTLAKTLDMVRRFRAGDDATPIILMGYYNPIYSYGNERFLTTPRRPASTV